MDTSWHRFVSRKLNQGKPGRWIVLCSLLTWLAGCATPADISPAARGAWLARQAELASLSRWQALGRIGVINGQEGWHANFQWGQQDTRYRIDLLGPLGQGRLLIEGDEAGVILHTQDGQQHTAPDPDTLLGHILGAQLPVSGLRYWLRGLPAPGSTPNVQTDVEGRLLRLEQNGWIIEYPAYIAVASGQLPARITAQRQDLSVKLVIEQWQL